MAEGKHLLQGYLRYHQQRRLALRAMTLDEATHDAFMAGAICALLPFLDEPLSLAETIAMLDQLRDETSRHMQGLLAGGG